MQLFLSMGASKKFRILITGGTGFIGSRLVKTLCRGGHQVTCLIRGTSSPVKIHQLQNLGVRLVHGDLTTDRIKLPHGIDIVFHLAALVSHRYSSYDPYRRVNVDGTRNLVEKLAGSGIQKFIFVSSIAAIGRVKTETGLVDENVQCNPVTPYGRSKLEAEKLLLKYHRTCGTPVIILRAPTVYGPGGKDGLFETIRFVAEKIKRGRPIVYIGRGDTLTSLCYIDNLIKALYLAMQSDCVGEIFHVDDGKPYTAREIITVVSQILGSAPSALYLPKSLLLGVAIAEEIFHHILGLKLSGLSREKLETISMSLAFDITKARKLLGYRPDSNFPELAKTTIKWYQQNNLL